MHLHAFSLTLLFSSITAKPYGSRKIDPSSFSKSDIIQRDVAVIGGGSSGTYSAISLKEKGFSTIVIEKKHRLGGHTETYIDPATGIPIDYGVQIWHNVDLVKNYFARFNVSLSTFNRAQAALSASYDYKTGKGVNATQYSAEEIGAAIAKYAQVISQWPQLDAGMFLPEPVPEDLVMPMGDFAKKYGIEAALPTMFNYNPGLGDFLSVPMVENLRIFGLSLVQSLQTGFLTTANHNNSELYSKAEAELLADNNLLLNSEVTVARRSDYGVKLVAQTPTGKKLVIAKKLLITIPSKLDYLRPFDLSRNETEVFKKFINAGYYTSVVRNTGIPSNLSVVNYVQDTPYNFLELPGIYTASASGVPGLHVVYYGAPRTSNTVPIPDDVVKANIVTDLKRLQKQNPGKFELTEPEFIKYSSHSPFYLQACPEDTKNGFYKSLYALQGGRSTYWTGASWRAQDSTDVWKFSEEVVLPQLTKGL